MTPYKQWRRVRELSELEVGMMVRHLSKINIASYLVTGNYGGRVTAVGSVDVTNPPEWEVLIGDSPTDTRPWVQCQQCFATWRAGDPDCHRIPCEGVSK
jgi:hypothetical protein